MDLKERIIEIKLKIADLKKELAIAQGTVSGIQNEISILNQIKCPNCNGAGVTRKDDPANNIAGITEPCLYCNGTGLISGNRQGY